MQEKRSPAKPIERIFTLEDGVATAGSDLTKHTLKNGNVIDAIRIGDVKRRVLSVDARRLRLREKKRVLLARFGLSQADRPKATAFDEDVVSPANIHQESAVVVIKSSPGFRGSILHTGDVQGLECRAWSNKGQCRWTADDASDFDWRAALAERKHCPACKREGYLYPLLRKFPKEDRLLEGLCRHGEAQAQQIIARVRRGEVFRVESLGTVLTPAASVIYGLYDPTMPLSAAGLTLHIRTWDERRQDDDPETAW